jgi:hypothetical protein
MFPEKITAAEKRSIMIRYAIFLFFDSSIVLSLLMFIVLLNTAMGKTMYQMIRTRQR